MDLTANPAMIEEDSFPFPKQPSSFHPKLFASHVLNVVSNFSLACSSVGRLQVLNEKGRRVFAVHDPQSA
jgi:hypothetical protein